MQFRWKSVLILLIFALPASLAGEMVSVFAKQQYQKTLEARRMGDVNTRLRYAYLATLQYSMEHKNHWPDADRWEQQLRPYVPSGFDFTLPAPRGTRPRRIAMNPRCGGKLVGDGTIILFFESVSTERNAHDDLHSLPTTADGSESYTLQFADGWEMSYPVAYCDSMRTDPGWVKRNLGDRQ